MRQHVMQTGRLLANAHRYSDGTQAGGGQQAKAKGLPTLEDFLGVRDFTGALTLLEFKLKHKF